ncbi:MAG: arginine--tRNA ligase [Christensenellales bacterium]
MCIDYSSINIAKQFHIGHLSSTAIGHALYNLYNFMGYKSVGINHLGDWGTQFGKLLAAYELWGDEAAVREKGVEEMTRLYVKFHEEAEKDPALRISAAPGSSASRMATRPRWRCSISSSRPPSGRS